MRDIAPKNADHSIGRHLRAGLIAAAVLLGGLGGWAVLTELAGAVLATGIIVVDQHVKKVQHQTGGIVGEINVRDGDQVEQGDLLVRFDKTLARANLAMVTKSLDALAVRRGRLEAERDGLAAIAFDPSLTPRLGEQELAYLVNSETGLFHSRREARHGEKSQFIERISQLEEQIEGFDLQAEAAADGVQLIKDELKGVEELYVKKLISLIRVMPLRREEVSLRGERGKLIAQIAETKARISEIELQIHQIDQNMRSEVTKELRELRERAAEMEERKIAALDQLTRGEIRAPVGGVVHQLEVHTVGGVVNAGETLMLIVPENDDLSIEVRIAAEDRDQVAIHQPVTLRMSAFSQRTTPELKGKVIFVAPDLVVDSRTGGGFYPVRIELLPGEVDNLGNLKLAPGMPVEAFIQTGLRTVFSYLVTPLSNYIVRAFRAD